MLLLGEHRGKEILETRGNVYLSLGLVQLKENRTEVLFKKKAATSLVNAFFASHMLFGLLSKYFRCIYKALSRLVSPEKPDLTHRSPE